MSCRFLLRGIAPVCAGVLALIGAVSPSAAQQSPIEGVWQTEEKSEVTIAACDEGFCGTISKIIVPEDVAAENRDALAKMDVEQFTDMKNKDAKLRSRPIMGLQILTLKPGKKPSVFDGDIYNPEDGNTYSGYVEVLAADKVRLNGCVLFNIVCQGQEWVRATPEGETPAASRGAQSAPQPASRR